MAQVRADAIGPYIGAVVRDVDIVACLRPEQRDSLLAYVGLPVQKQKIFYQYRICTCVELLMKICVVALMRIKGILQGIVRMDLQARACPKHGYSRGYLGDEITLLRAGGPQENVVGIRFRQVKAGGDFPIGRLGTERQQCRRGSSAGSWNEFPE